MVLILLGDRDQSIISKSQSSTMLYPALVCVCCLLSILLSLYYYVLVYSQFIYLYIRSEDILKIPSAYISIAPRALPSLSGYQYPEVYPCISHLTPDTTKPIGSSWYLGRI